MHYLAPHLLKAFAYRHDPRLYLLGREGRPVQPGPHIYQSSKGLPAMLSSIAQSRSACSEQAA